MEEKSDGDRSRRCGCEAHRFTKRDAPKMVLADVEKRIACIHGCDRGGGAKGVEEDEFGCKREAAQ